MKPIPVIATVLALLPAHLPGQGSSPGSSHLKVSFNARAAAMSDALVADPGVFLSWGLNPANLADVRSYEILLGHAEWIQDVQSELIVGSVPLSFGTTAISISNTNVKGIEVRDRPGPALGTFSSRSVAFGLSFAAAPLENLGLGATAKYLYEKLYVDEATGYSIDLGAAYALPVQGFALGFSVTNLGTMSAFRSQPSELPLMARVGGSYRFEHKEIEFVFAAAGVRDVRLSDTHAHVGIEATYNKLAAARAGYQSGFEARGFTAGFGLRYGFAEFDYAYVPFSLGLGSAHLFSLAIRF